ncbi:MAG: hypothetical protein AAF543_06315 [Pseudomonadota bacterium]
MDLHTKTSFLVSAVSKAKPALPGRQLSKSRVSELCPRLQGRFYGQTACLSAILMAFTPSDRWSKGLSAPFAVRVIPGSHVAGTTTSLPNIRRVNVDLASETLCELSLLGQTFLRELQKFPLDGNSRAFFDSWHQSPGQRSMFNKRDQIGCFAREENA